METKPFYKTTEFWLSSLAQLLLWVGALPTAGGPPWLKSVISSAVLLGYTLSRGIAKSGSSYQQPVTRALSRITKALEGTSARGANPRPAPQAKLASLAPAYPSLLADEAIDSPSFSDDDYSAPAALGSTIAFERYAYEDDPARAGSRG